jgi:hypothetical protein
VSLTRKQFALVVLGWALFGWLHGTLLYYGIRSEGAVPQWTLSEFVVRQAARWMLWALLTPAVVLLSRRVPLALRLRPILIHLAASVIFPAIRAAGIVLTDSFVVLRPVPWVDRPSGCSAATEPST